MKKRTIKKPAEKKPAAKNKKLPGRLLAPNEPKAFRLENLRGRGVGLIICDHASNRVPRSLKNLGMRKEDLLKHIGWDIGGEDASLYLSKALDMPAVLASYSRLVLDLNRAPAHRECMADVSDHIQVPANKGLSKAERARRLKEIYQPYQNQIGKQVDLLLKRKKTPLLIAVHSFTPEMDGIKRPWHIAILWHREEAIAKRVIREIRKNHPDVLVGENEPYTLNDERFKGSTMCCHAEERGLPYIFVEFRQDLINTREKAHYWADLFLQAIKPVIDSPEFFRGRKIKPYKI